MSYREKVNQAADLVDAKLNALGLSKVVEVNVVYDPEINDPIVKATYIEHGDRFGRRYFKLVNNLPLEDQVKVFMNWFEGRIDYLKAPSSLQIESWKNNIHPQRFKNWVDLMVKDC